MTKVILGAPSLDEKGANERVQEAFSLLDFPLKLTFTNLAGHAQHYPSIALYVEAGGHERDSAVREIQSFEALIALSTSVESMANMYRESQYLEISYDITEEEQLAIDETKRQEKADAKRGKKLGINLSESDGIIENALAVLAEKAAAELKNSSHKQTNKE